MDIIKIKNELDADPVLYKNLRKLVLDCIAQRTNLFSISDSIILQKLLDVNAVLKFDDDSYELKLDSQYLIPILFEISEELAEKVFPRSLPEVFDYIDSFEKNALTDPKFNNWRGSREMIRSLEKYSSLYLNQIYGIGVKVLFETLADQAYHEKDWYFDCQESFYGLLPYMNYEISELYDVLVSIRQMKDDSHYANEILYNLTSVNAIASKELYNLGLEKDLLVHNGLASYLIAYLYNRSEISLYEEAADLMRRNKSAGLSAFSLIRFKNTSDLQNSFKLIKSSSFNEQEDLKNLTLYLFSIIASDQSDFQTATESFQMLHSLAEIHRGNISPYILMVSKIQKGFESERYSLLLDCLGKGADRKLISDYFIGFDDPKYFFNLYIYYVSKRGLNVELNLFERSINRFWQTSREKTEKNLLGLITHKNLLIRYSSVKLITLGHNIIVDLLKIKEAEKQLLTISPLLTYPHSIESLLPIAIKLKDSEHQTVRSTLEASLNMLIIQAYGKGIYDLAEPFLDKKKDQKLIKSLKNTLQEYIESIDAKNKINDLNPRLNESDLMKFYIKLDNEKNYEITKEATQADPMMAFYSTKNIVRGNSWKVGEMAPTPLSTYSINLLIDKRMVLNPDLFEMNLNNAFNVNE